MTIETTSVLGIRIARLSLEGALKWIADAVEAGKPRHIVTANAEIIYRAYTNRKFASLLQKADLFTADGSGVVWAAKYLGRPVPQRVTGIDLLTGLFPQAEEKDWSLYFLGAAPQVVEKAVLNVLGNHTRLKVAGYHHGYFSLEEKDQVVENIKKVTPDILLVALGSPRQERFIQEHLGILQVPVSIGVGGSFDVLAGTSRRAPAWMQRRGLEWLYRLAKQPSRFIRMLALPKFVLAVARQKRWGQKRF